METQTQVSARLAAEADVDIRTAQKALVQGATAVRGRVGERVTLAAKRLGIQLGQVAS
jgi:hypothetical protein